MRVVPTRASLVLLLAPILLLPGWYGGVARAQVAAPSVQIRLVSETVWTGPKRPLQLAVRVMNTTDTALTDLTLVLSIWSPARSRSVYELSLTDDATTFLFGLPFPQTGSIEPGQSRVLRIRQPLDVPTARGESALYPLKVQLLSRDTAVATLRTPMIFLIERPTTPLHLAWTMALAAPLQRRPDGVFQEGPLFDDIAPGGAIDAMVTALDEVTPSAVDLALSPVLAEQLTELSGGFRLDRGGSIDTVPAGAGSAVDAARILAGLRRAAGRPRTELATVPYGDALLPALGSAGLDGSLEALVDRGREVLSSAVGATPSPSVFRPPQSQLDARSAGALSLLGLNTLLVDPSTLPEIPGLTFSPPAVIHLSGQGSSTLAISPDPGVVRAIQASGEDPRLAAQNAIGELAATWLEFPGTPGRGAAVLFSSTQALPAQLLRSFVVLVQKSPWIRATTASDLVTLVQQPGDQELPDLGRPEMSRAYVEQIGEVRADLARFAAAVEGGGALLGRLQDRVLLAEGEIGVTDPLLGESYLNAVRGAIRSTYEHVHPPPSGSIVTLTSQRGSLPLTLTNEGSLSLRVTLRLVADRRLQFPQGEQKELTLPAGEVTLVRVAVRALTTGRFPLRVEVQTASDRARPVTIVQSELIIRSTAYNRVALILTIGAALFLFAWWGRRFLPRRRS